MKKILILVCTALLIISICGLPAMAYTDHPAELNAAREIVKAQTPVTPGELPEEFSWAYLVTTGGAAVFVFVVAQFAKAPLDRVWKIPTRLLVYLLSFITLLVASYFLNDGLQIETVALCAFNALISAFSAYGMYEVYVRKKE